MPISRRVALGAAAGAVVVAGGGVAGWRLLAQGEQPGPALPPSAVAPPSLAPSASNDPRLTDRSVGRADAPVTVMEFYSLTCPHCAAFYRETFPRIKSELIDTGKLRFVFWDFPLDQVALTAAMVARTLPPERYEPFTAALLASQDRGRSPAG